MLRVIRADNPSPLTGPGTNTFLIGQGEVAVIDPGPDLPGHRAAILQAVGSGRVAAILVTHPHLDHSAGAGPLAAATGAPILAFGGATEGRRAPRIGIAEVDGAGGEGLDITFTPDRRLRDGEIVAGEGWSLTALHTPGHAAAHMAFQWGERLFCGDLILGWSSTLISPPDGDLGDYMASLGKVAALRPSLLLPAHGDPIADPQGRIAALAAHRRARTAEILAALSAGPATAEALARRLYDIPEPLLPAAVRNVTAHLLVLADLGALRPDGDAFARVR